MLTVKSHRFNLLLTDTHPSEDVPLILMLEAHSITAISFLLNSKLQTIVLCLTASEISLHLRVIPREASVLEAFVVSITSLSHVSAVIISQANREPGKIFIRLIFSTEHYWRQEAQAAREI